MATSTATAFRPWATDVTEESSLKDVLSRVNLERGHFRDITEASLQEEIAGEGGLELSESDDELGDENDDADTTVRTRVKPTSRDDLYAAQTALGRAVWQAEQDILMSLDFVSLLLSKHLTSAASAMSPVLKEKVPAGTLGTDIWQRMPVDKAREAQDSLLATNVRLEALSQSADDLLSAATRLQDNVRTETRYWNQVLSISDKGWSVCRVPGPGKSRLAVRFGCSESAPEFSRRGIAALDADAEGGIMLEQGFGSKPKAMQVLVRRNGSIIGSSQLPDLSNTSRDNLEARIRHARDSLFDKELYHELIRESRSILSLGARVGGSSVSFRFGTRDDTEVELRLTDLDDANTTTSPDSHESDAVASAALIAARLLLGHAHRERLRKRSQLPAPLSDKAEDRPLLPILRPLMSILLHHSALDTLNDYLEGVQKVLSAASVDCTVQSARFELGSIGEANTPEVLVKALMKPYVSTAELTVDDLELGDFAIKLKIETTLEYNFGTIFTLTAPDVPEMRLASIAELIAACNSGISNSLAALLAESSGDKWTCEDRDALLVVEDEADAVRKQARITLDASASSATLALRSPTQEVTWRSDEEKTSKGLRSACGDMLV